MVRKGDLSVDQIGASWFETARAYCAVRRGLAYARPARARAPPHHEGLERRHLFSPHPEERPTGRVSKDGRDRTADTAPHSRGAICVRALHHWCRSLKQRAQGMPGARRTRSLVCENEKSKRANSPQVRRNDPALPAQWFYGLLRALPGVSGFLATVAC